MTIPTKSKRQIIDITDEVQAAVTQDCRAILVFVAHSTAALTTADLDPGTDQDFLDFLVKITPSGQWRHPHNPEHAPDHLLTSLIGCQVVVPVEAGTLQLGTWQRIVLVELDGPRDRTIHAQPLA